MIKRYVKGARNVNRFFGMESIRSDNARPGWLPEVASNQGGFPKLASLDSKRNPAWPGLRFRKALIMSQEFRQAPQGGFQVDSPVKKPRASEMPRSAPPYTNRVREEPCRGGVLGLLLTLIMRFALRATSPQGLGKGSNMLLNLVRLKESLPFQNESPSNKPTGLLALRHFDNLEFDNLRLPEQSGEWLEVVFLGY